LNPLFCEQAANSTSTEYKRTLVVFFMLLD